jgi:hypothetical protein
MNKAIAEMSADAAVLISHFSGLEKGTLVTYDQIRTLIGWDIRDNRGVLNTVRNRLLKDDGKVLGVVVGEGYKILTNQEICNGELRRDREKRRRNAVKSKSKAGSVDIGSLNESDRISLLAEVTTAHLTAEASKDKSVLQIGSHLNGANQPLALNHALDAIKKNLTSTKQQ